MPSANQFGMVLTPEEFQSLDQKFKALSREINIVELGDPFVEAVTGLPLHGPAAARIVRAIRSDVAAPLASGESESAQRAAENATPRAFSRC
jgi:hypothetical protein